MVKLLPQNAVAFARYILGNALTDALGVNIKGSDIDLGDLGEEAKNVLRTAVENARADKRSYVEYRDYPKMASGERPEDFWKAKRAERDLLDLYVESATDPVLEMFTSVGGFKFKNRPDGGFEIPNDPYDFDKSKSTKKRKVKDTYSELTYMGQDASGGYSFSLKGVIDPVGSSAKNPKRFQNMKKGGSLGEEETSTPGNLFDKASDTVSNLLNKAYNTIDYALMEKGKVTNDDAPPELITYLREGFNRGSFPHPLPEYFNNAVVQDGRVVVADIIDIELPPTDFDAGDIPEIEYDDDPFLQVGPYSTRRKARMENELAVLYGEDSESFEV